MKKLEIEKTKPILIISVLKVDIIKVGLVFSISNFFITKTPLANNWRRKKIPSCSYLALNHTQITCLTTCTGKSLSEALLFAEHGENMLCIEIVLKVKNNFCKQLVLPMF